MLAYAESVVPKAKISLGFPAYGYDWNLTAGGGDTIAWNQVPALIKRTGAVPQWDDATSSPWFTYTAANGSSPRRVVRECTQHCAKGVAGRNERSGERFGVGAGAGGPDLLQAIASGFGAGLK
ncbi:MAG: glycosyl hydrolase family 18 protein [Rhodospirillales bacterium]